MSGRATSGSPWDERIARARTLASEHPAARQALTFYAALAEYQKTLAGETAANTFDAQQVLAEIPNFISWLPGVSPTRLATSIADLQKLDREAWSDLLQSYLARPDSDGEVDSTVVFVLEALLQPFAERSARHGPAPAPDRALFPVRCPVCGGLPVLGVLREEGQGASRALLCALCFTELDYLRIVCPNCGEQQFESLPVFTADQFDYVRIEGCDRCHRYVKTIDLTKNGLAVPPVDDIASVALDLWARERGYGRIKANLLAL